MVHQRNQWIHSGHGFISSFDALWSEWSWITDHWSWSQRNAPLLNVSLYYFRFKDSGEVCKMTITEIKTYRKKLFLIQQPALENSNFFSLQLILPLFLDCEVTGYVLGFKKLLQIVTIIIILSFANMFEIIAHILVLYLNWIMINAYTCTCSLES